MFKKLKEKITEEVKISPQRFVEFTQSVSDRLQNSSTSDDNFFSIGDDDTNTSVDSNNHGFSSVQLMSPSQERPRKNSTSSIASDVSFLPRYEPGSMYHLQSDLEVSASEVEDNLSTASSQLGHLTKEQIYSAFQKAQMRYHKYRGRYTDLSRHYKNLERENSKIKSVFEETQDKAIRRVTELREQCTLEQKAKAHLESALRDEIDERNYKIKSLQMKIELLQNESTSNSIISVEDSGNSTENLENLTKYLNESRKEIELLNAKIQELKANSIVFQSKEQEYKSKISNLEKEIVQFSEREKENNLNLAQNKMEIHNEILIKDNEISNLKRDTESLKQKLESIEAESKSSTNQKLENLQSQNKKLIEKVESLTQKSNNLENELLKMETYKQEIKNVKEKDAERLKEITNLEKLNEELAKNNSELNDVVQKEREDHENQISQLREDAKKGLISLEPKIRDKLQTEFTAKEEELRKEFTNKIEELSSNNNTSKELQMLLMEKESLIKNTAEEFNRTKSELVNKGNALSDLEKNHLELIDNCTELRNVISNLEKDKLALEAQEEKVARLEAHIKTLQEELKVSEGNAQKAVKELTNIKEALASSGEQIRILEERNKAMELQSSDNNLLLKNFEDEKSHLLKQFENEKVELNKIIERCNKDIVELKKDLDEERDKVIEERCSSEKELSELQEKVRLLEQKDTANGMAKNEAKLLDLKLEQLEETNAKNLEESEKEREFISEELASIWKDLNLKEEEENYDTFIEAGLNLRLNILKKMCQKKDEIYNNLVSEHTNLTQENIARTIQLDQLKQDISNVNTTNEHFNINMQHLQDDFNENKRLLQERDDLVNQLSSQSEENQNKISELEILLSNEMANNSKLSKEITTLEGNLKDFEEKYLLLDTKQEVLELTKSECGILQLKLQKSEEDNRNLSQLLEEGRLSVEKTSKEHLESTKTIKELEESNQELRTKIDNDSNNLERLSKRINELENEIKEIKEERDAKAQELEETTIEIETIRKEKEAKEKEIVQLSEVVSNLTYAVENQAAEFNNLLAKTQLLDSTLENLKKDNSDALKKEKDSQSELVLKVDELQTQLDKNTAELSENNIKFSELEQICIQKEGRCKQAKLEVDNYTSELMSKTSQLESKDQEIHILKEEINSLRGEILELNKEIFQKGQLDTQLVHSENEMKLLKTEREKIKEEMEELNVRIQHISMDNRNVMEENQSLSQEKEELKIALELLKEQQGSELDRENLKKENLSLKDAEEDLLNQVKVLETEIVNLKSEKNASSTNGSEIAKIQEDFYEIKEKCDSLFIENKNLKQEYGTLEEKCNSFGKIKQKLESQISELEGHYSELLREKQLLEDEVQELKTSPVNYQNDTSKLDNLDTLKTEQTLVNDGEKQHYLKEIELLREKLTKYKSLDLTNKSSIEFYENELQKMKNQNDKLNRKLDETLVTLNHCAELSTSTEVEYLKNVLFNYMLGKESVVLARVIAAVCKFDPQQTELIMQKEQQKQTLLGHLGLI